MQVLTYCSSCPLRLGNILADVTGRDCPLGCKQARTERPPYTMDPGQLQLIRALGDPVLRQVAQPVTQIDKSIETLVAQLFATMRTSGGIGLSAPQIGVSLRVAVVEVEGRAWTLINPVITSVSAEWSIAEEGCLSIPGHWGTVERPAVVGVKTLLLSEPFRADGLAGRAVQHEIDHLSGVLFTDHAQSVRTNGRVWNPVLAHPWQDGQMMCPGCGYVYTTPQNELDVLAICHVEGCRTPLLKVKGTGSWIRRQQRSMSLPYPLKQDRQQARL